MQGSDLAILHISDHRNSAAAHAALIAPEAGCAPRLPHKKSPTE